MPAEASAKAGLLASDADVMVSVGSGYFLTDDPREMDHSVLGGKQYSVSGGPAAKFGYGGRAGVGADLGLGENGEFTTYSRKAFVTLGVGVESPINGSVGVGWAKPAKRLLDFRLGQ